MSRKGMKRSAEDRRFSQAVRERDYWTCQRCGTWYTPPTTALHCAHIFSRGKEKLRHDMRNAVALCYGCHRYLDTHPAIKREFFINYLGKEAYEELELLSNQTKKGMAGGATEAGASTTDAGVDGGTAAVDDVAGGQGDGRAADGGRPAVSSRAVPSSERAVG